MEAIEKKIEEVYKEKGLRGVYSYLAKSGIEYRTEVYEFGLSGSKAAEAKKAEFLKGEICFHYYSLAVKSRKTGWNYNRIRGIKIVLK